MDIEQPNELRAYLRARGDLVEGQQVSLQTLYGGVSNRTVLVSFPNAEAWVLKQALEKLRVSVDWYSSVERVHREAAGMRALARFAPVGSICEFIFEDKREHVLAMKAVAQPHENWKVVLLQGRLNSAHVSQFANLLASVHRNAANVPEVRNEFGERSFFETLRLEPYYLYSAEQVPEAASFLHALVTNTRKRLFTLVHGDYSPKNILVYKDQLILLDHEVIHYGDPAFDLGFALTHLVSKAHHLSQHQNTFAGAAKQFWTTYQTRLGDTEFRGDLELYTVKHTLACLLARVAGRSPLEYLNTEEQDVQQRVVLGLMKQEPESVNDLINKFIKGVQRVRY